MQVATGAEAKTQLMPILLSEKIPAEAIESIMEEIQEGGIVGRDPDFCILGTVARYSGMTYAGVRNAFGLSENWRENPIEVFAYGICSGHTHQNNSDLAQVLMWCDEALLLRKELCVSDSPIKENVHALSMG